MVGRTTARTSIQGRLAAALGSALIVASLVATISPVMADPASPLLVTKTANPSPVTSGGQLTYTVSITNTGGSKIDTVVMTDQVNGVGTIQSPPGLPQLTITSTQGPCTQGGPNGNVVTCQIGTISGGGTVTVTIRGQVTAANGTSLNNTASVSGTKSAQNFTTNASAQVLVQGTSGGGNAPDLTLNKTGPTSVATGANFDYVLTVNNLGNANTANVKVIDTLPAGVTLQAPASPTIPFETTSLFSCSPSGNPITITCTGGAVNAGQNATIKIHAVAPGTAGQITNTAIVDPDQQIAESNELNNSSAAVNTNVTTAPPPAGLTIAKTDGSPGIPGETWDNGAGPDPVNPGQVLTYKLQVVNKSTTRADDVVITDGTQSLEASSIIASQVIANGTVGQTGGCFVNAPQVTCKVRTLNAGGTITITIQGLVVSTAGASIFNSATVTGNIKNVGVQASSSESTTVRPAVDLTITKADGPDPVCARSWPTTSNPSADHLLQPGGSPAAIGDIPPVGLLDDPVCLGGLTYTFMVGNSGNTAATGVAIRDQLAPGVIFDSWDTDGGFTCSLIPTNVVSCTGGSIPAAELRQIRFRVVAPNNLGTLTNSVTVDPNNAIFEPDETNNDATTTTDVRTGIDLTIWKSDNGVADNIDPPGPVLPLTEGFDPVATSGTDTYTIIVDNIGTQDATGIKVVDTLPAGTKFLSVTSTPGLGFNCGHNGAPTGGTVTCFGGHLVGTESEFYNPPGPTNATTGHDEYVVIKIKVFVTPFIQQVGQTMHNEVRVDPDDTIDEVNEQNNLATDDTIVTTGNNDIGAFNQLTIDKTQFSPAANGAVATNGILIYNLHVENLGTDPVSNVEVQDTLPAGTRFISATDATTVGPSSAKFFCAHDGSATGGLLTCIGGDFSGSLNKIGTGLNEVPIARDIRVKVFAPNTPQIAVNVGTVDPDNLVPEGNEFDNDDDQTTTVAPCTSLANCGTSNAVYELTIDKTQTKPADPVARNGIITYDLKVENLGSDPVSGVTVTDQLPAGFRFILAHDTVPGAAEAFHCTGPDAAGLVTCTGGSLSGTVTPIPGGAPTVRHIEIRVFAPDIPGAYTNNAFVDPNHAIPEGNEFNNQDSLITNVTNGGNGPFIDLTVIKTQEKLPGQEDVTVGTDTLVQVTPGGPIKYILEVKNTATPGVDAGTAFNVTVRDLLPANVTFFSAADEAAGPGNFTCAQVPGQPNTIDCTGGTIPAGGSRKIDVFAVAPTGLDQIATNQSDIQQTLTNSAFVDPNNAILEGDETNNVAVLKTQVRSKINLTADKEGPDNASQNQEDDYVITVKNNKVWGQGDIAVDAVVIDTLPVGLIPLGVTTSAGNFLCNVLENPVNTVQCVGDLEPDQQVVITVHVFITQKDGTMYNQACIDPDHLIDETNELDNCDTKTTNVGEEPPPPPPDTANLNINKNASASLVTPGQTFDYTISVSNVGTGASPAPLKITDDISTLPLTFVSATGTNGFTCTNTAGLVECTGASGLAAGASTLITIQVTATNAATTAFTNTATVPDPDDPNEPDDVAEDSVTTNVSGADVAIAVADISDSPDPVLGGAVVTYTIVVTNSGTGTANGLDITDTLLDTTGLTFLSAVGSQGFTCTWSGPAKTVTCSGNLPAGQSTILTIKFDTDSTTITPLFSTVFADSNLEFSEVDEVDNFDSEQTTVDSDLCTSCYDLVMGPIFANPDPVADGAQVTFNFDVTNVGDIPTSSDPDAPTDEVVIAIDVDTTFNDYLLGSLSVNVPGFACVLSDNGGTNSAVPEAVCTKMAGLAGGEGVIASVTVTADTGGPSFLFFDAEADPGNLVGGEFNETNNSGGITVTVS